jgi:NADP-dependent 3-hydroxy acid dehydrogenase YdfG
MAEQVWFVTGALRGLGRSVVEQALGAGHRVVGGARRVDALSEFGQSHPGRFLALPLDVTDAARAQSAIGETVSGFGRLDVVVINAGYANIAPIEEIDLDDFRSQFDAVFLGTVYVTKAALPVFHAQGSGAAALQKTIEEDQQWAQLGRSVDFDATGVDLPEHRPAPASG